MKSNKLLFLTIGAGVAVSLFVMHRLNERRLQAMERELRSAAERQVTAADEPVGTSPRLQAAALAATLTAGARCPAPTEASKPAPAAEPVKDRPATEEPVASPEDRAAYVDSVWKQEQADPAWSRGAEGSISQALREHVGTATLESLECRKTLCKARFKHEDNEHFGTFIDQIVGSSAALWKGEISSYRDPPGADGVVRNSIYFSKEGTETPTL